MSNNSLLKDFFQWKVENQLTAILNSESDENIELKVKEYIDGLLFLPVIQFIDYIRSLDETLNLDTMDVYQFSQFSDATIGVCNVIALSEGKTATSKDIGKKLQNDGKARKDEANRRYGADHANMACLLGLLHKVNHNYYLTAIGRAFLNLSEEKQSKLLTRLILRTKLMQKVLVEIQKHEIDFKVQLYMIETSTYGRRSSSIKQVMENLENSKEYDFSQFTHNIHY